MNSSLRSATALIVAVITITGAGCASGMALRHESAQKIGCPADEVAITDYKTANQTATWNASCRGQTYRCDLADAKKGVVCNPATP